MRIEWLNRDRTCAKVTRGRLWWKRVTVVARRDSAYGVWRFETSGRECPGTMDRWIDRQKSLADAKDRERGHDDDWFRPSDPIPKARALK